MSEQDRTEPLDSEREAAVRARAYALWHEQGQPEGKDQEHWLQAEQEHDGHGDPTATPATGDVSAERHVVSERACKVVDDGAVRDSRCVKVPWQTAFPLHGQTAPSSSRSSQGCRKA